RRPRPPTLFPYTTLFRSNLKRVEICRASGDLPNAYCPQRGWTWFIPGKSPIRVSTVHRAVAVDRATGRASCGPYDPARMRLEVRSEEHTSELQSRENLVC